MLYCISKEFLRFFSSKGNFISFSGIIAASLITALRYLALYKPRRKVLAQRTKYFIERKVVLSVIVVLLLSYVLLLQDISYNNKFPNNKTDTIKRKIESLQDPQTTKLMVSRAKITIEKVETNGDKFKAGSELAKNVKFTSTLGGCQLKSLEAGEYLITAIREGFIAQTAKAFINDGEMSEVKMENGRV